MAEYADRVRVPAEALKLSVSAPPNIFRHVKFPYALPSTFPKSVPVLSDIRPRSRAEIYMSMSVGEEFGFVGSGRSMKVEMGS